MSNHLIRVLSRLQTLVGLFMHLITGDRHCVALLTTFPQKWLMINLMITESIFGAWAFLVMSSLLDLLPLKQKTIKKPMIE
jgi:hypothetical protein